MLGFLVIRRPVITLKHALCICTLHECPSHELQSGAGRREQVPIPCLSSLCRRVPKLRVDLVAKGAHIAMHAEADCTGQPLCCAATTRSVWHIVRNWRPRSTCDNLKGTQPQQGSACGIGWRGKPSKILAMLSRRAVRKSACRARYTSSSAVHGWPA